jgi:hypothetical protein
MTISITNISPVNLDGTITSSSLLDVLHGTQSVDASSNNLHNTLTNIEDTEVVLADFDVSGTTHQVHAWEILFDRSLSKWSRATASSVSGTREAMDNDVVVVAVPPGVSVPETPAAEGPPAPGTTQKKIRIKIEKQGGMPIPPRRP